MWRSAVFICTVSRDLGGDAFWDAVVAAKPRRLKLRQRDPDNFLYDGGEYFYFHCDQRDAPIVEEIWSRFAASELLERAQSRQECVWTTQEIDDAELLVIYICRAPIVPRVRMHVDFEQPRHDRPFPWAWQAGPLKLVTNELPKSSFAINEACDSYLVHEDVVAQVDALRSDGVLLEPILHRKTGDPTGWQQLMPRMALPALAAGTTGVITEGPAGPGGRPAHFDTMAEGFAPRYRRSKIVDRCGGIPAIGCTEEMYGVWRSSADFNMFARPKLVVSQAVRRQLRSAGVTRLNYVPVELIDD